MTYPNGLAGTGAGSPVPGPSFLNGSSGPGQGSTVPSTAALLPFVRSQAPPPCPPIVQHSPQPQLPPPSSQAQQVILTCLF